MTINQYIKKKVKDKAFLMGFTIIELLVVVAIAAMILSIVFIFLQGVRTKSRDTRREQDIKQLQTALNLYEVNHRRFPICDPIDLIDQCLIPLVTEGVIPVLPTDPFHGSTGVCEAEGSHVYCYKSARGSSYDLYYNLETDTILGKSAGWQKVGP